MIKDSGERRQFETGAVRDMGENGIKGRCDLLPVGVISFMTGDPVLYHINEFLEHHHSEELWNAIVNFAEHNFPGDTTKGKIATVFLEVAMHYEEGCKKYGERNWEKGIPLHCYIDSGIRHYLKYTRGDEDERHDRAFIWNMLGAIWTKQNKPEMDDLPKGADE